VYIQHYIKTVHFWLKYNGLAIVQKTTKLIEGGHCGLQDYRHVITSTFLTFFYVFFLQNPKSPDFYVFCSVLYVFSNYASMTSWLNEAEVSIQSTGPLARPLLSSITGRGFSHVKYLVNNNVLTETTSMTCAQVNVTFR